MDLLLQATRRIEDRDFWFRGLRRFLRPLLAEAVAGRPRTPCWSRSPRATHPRTRDWFVVARPIGERLDGAGAAINAMLDAALALEAVAHRVVPMPFGSSLLVLARKPGRKP